MEAIVANLLGATALTLSLGGVANVPAPNGAHAAPTVTAQYEGYGSAALGATGFAQATSPTFAALGDATFAQVGSGWVAGLGAPTFAQVGDGWVAGLDAPTFAGLGAPAFANLGATTFAGLGRVRTPTRPTDEEAPADEFGRHYGFGGGGYGYYG
jgi:hypothetical protein